MSDAIIRNVTASQIKELPEFGPGDTVKVHVRIKEGDKERVQAFQGIVLSRKGSGSTETMTVRKVSGGVGVERVFPIHSPNVTKIEIIKHGKVRRAKLYYLRKKKGKAAKVKEKRAKK
ncbi:50S ribosomal protein L19 [bacterium]|nr:MAG: 50S ribosomal protein L19 [bacterium]